MKIGVISDTHLNGYDEELQQIINRHFREVDLVIHAGDITALSVLDMFGDKEVMAVCGNMDADLQGYLPPRLEWTLGGYRFGLIHGWGDPRGLRQVLRAQFAEIDCLVYGHTHQPFNEMVDGVLYFNPGSTSENRMYSSKTIGIIEVSGGLTGKIIAV